MIPKRIPAINLGGFSLREVTSFDSYMLLSEQCMRFGNTYTRPTHISAHRTAAAYAGGRYCAICKKAELGYRTPRAF